MNRNQSPKIRDTKWHTTDTYFGAERWIKYLLWCKEIQSHACSELLCLFCGKWVACQSPSVFRLSAKQCGWLHVVTCFACLINNCTETCRMLPTPVCQQPHTLPVCFECRKSRSSLLSPFWLESLPLWEIEMRYCIPVSCIQFRHPWSQSIALGSSPHCGFCVQHRTPFPHRLPLDWRLDRNKSWGDRCWQSIRALIQNRRVRSWCKGLPKPAVAWAKT